LKLALKTIFFLQLVILGGCSWVPDDVTLFDGSEYDYTKAIITEEMKVPESMGEANIQDHFLVPDLGDDVVGEVYGPDKEVMAPMQVLTLGNKARVNRESKDSSVFITESEIRLWDSVERFLIEENIQVASKDLSKGSYLTGWHVKRDDSFWKDEISAWRYRYEIKLDEAKRANENLVSVKIIDAQEYLESANRWRTLSDTKRIETEFLNSILGFMYVENITSSRQLVNQSALGGITVSLGTDKDNNPALLTSASFDHVWTRIPISLKLLSMKVDDQDRSQGLFFISNDEDEEGFFASLAFWSSDDKNVLDIPEGNYRLQVAKKGENVSIAFMDDENKYLTTELLAKNYPLLSKAFKSRASD